jgi:predicted metalloenzyme YecM
LMTEMRPLCIFKLDQPVQVIDRLLTPVTY